MSNVKKDVIGYECRFAWHIPAKGNTPDYHVIKVQTHYKNGEIKPELKFIKNFERTVYVTRKSKQDHTQKKEFEKIENLLEITATQSDVVKKISKVLERPWDYNKSLKEIAISPYVYGTDISSCSLLKERINSKNPELKTKYTAATFDIETDVFSEHKDILVIATTFKNKAFISITESFVRDVGDLRNRFELLKNQYIKDIVEKHQLEIEIVIGKDQIEVIKNVFSKLHEWKPDFLTIWNMNFDIPVVLDVLKRHNVKSVDILCDPEIPEKLRKCEYRQGLLKKTTASGKQVPISPASQWHTLELTASFYVIDAMCVYKQLRLAKQEESSYSLDSILDKELGIRKLKFDKADKYSKLAWHKFMQREYKVEYILYNLFDSLSMQELESKLKDITSKLPDYSGNSVFSKFKSQPSKITDALHFYLKDNGYIIGSVGAKRKSSQEDTSEIEEDENSILSLAGWIITLAAHLTVDGIRCIVEDFKHRTRIRTHCRDIDLVSAYPTNLVLFNICQLTTKREIIRIENIPEETFRLQNINLLSGDTNSIQYCTTMFNMPKPREILALYRSSL